MYHGSYCCLASRGIRVLILYCSAENLCKQPPGALDASACRARATCTFTVIYQSHIVTYVMAHAARR